MKNIMITGAGQGIGFYLAKQLLADGYHVTVLDLNVSGLDELAKTSPGLLSLVCDVRDQTAVCSAVDRSIREFGNVDCAIHNACRCTFGPMEESAEETFREVFDVNYFGALHLARAVLPHMRERRQGKIIFTSSGVGVTGFADISPYASSKGAIEALAKCLNIEYQGSGITFHLFHPPLTRTQSAAPLPVPKEFMALPEKVGAGLAKRVEKRSFVLCHSVGQKLQMAACYLFPVSLGKRLGKMMSRMTAQPQKDGK